MEDEKDAFYIVRKGDIIGVYRSLSECQEQAGTSVTHSAMSVFKGYGWPKAAEDLVSSFGIKNALFSVNASNVKDDTFGELIPCPVRQPPSSSKRLQEMGNDESCSLSLNPPQKHLKTENVMVPQTIHSRHVSQPDILNDDIYTIEFDGVSMEHPGKAGAGAVIRASDNSILFYLREGVGIATHGVADYRALILGLKFALNKGFRNVRVQGESMRVCMQIKDVWKINQPKMIELCQQAKELRSQFKTFHIQHLDRELSSVAYEQANYAISLADGHIVVIPGG